MLLLIHLKFKDGGLLENLKFVQSGSILAAYKIQRKWLKFQGKFSSDKKCQIAHSIW